jgi:hypothetical protein
MHPAGAKTTQRQHKITRHNDISLLGQKKKLWVYILEFSGLYYYHLKEGRKPEKTPDDLFIRCLLPV